MKKTNRNLIIVNAIFIMSLLVANVVAGKIVTIYGLIVPGAVVAYGLTFLCTDIINELWGKQEANHSVKLGFIIQIISLGLILLAIWLPPAKFATEFDEHFKIVLGQNARVVIASLIAYIISQAHDVVSFNFWKEKTKGKHRWLRNNVSTITSQLIDTSIFITIAFWGEVPNLLLMIVSQYIVKCIIALIDTPLFYLFTQKEN